MGKGIRPIKDLLKTPGISQLMKVGGIRPEVPCRYRVVACPTRMLRINMSGD